VIGDDPLERWLHDQPADRDSRVQFTIGAAFPRSSAAGRICQGAVTELLGDLPAHHGRAAVNSADLPVDYRMPSTHRLLLPHVLTEQMPTIGGT
jgi:hypothetical protein